MSNKEKEQLPVEITKNDRLFDGFIKLDKATASVLTTENKRITITREIHDHGNSVTILPVDKDRQKAILIGQWRIPAWVNNYKQRLWEAPAGLLEENEDPADCAIREALEETGYKVSDPRLISSAFTSPGLVTERAYIYLADYSQETQQHTNLGLKEEGEDIELREFSFDELFDMVDKGELHDAVTIIAVYALREELRRQ